MLQWHFILFFDHVVTVAHIISAKYNNEFVKHTSKFTEHNNEFVKHKSKFTKHNNKFVKHKSKFTKYNNKFVKHKSKFTKHNTEVISFMTFTQRANPTFVNRLHNAPSKARHFICSCERWLLRKHVLFVVRREYKILSNILLLWGKDRDGNSG